MCVRFGFEFGSSTESQWISITIVDVKAVPTFFPRPLLISLAAPPLSSFPSSHHVLFISLPTACTATHLKLRPTIAIDSDRNGFIFHLNMRATRNGKK